MYAIVRSGGKQYRVRPGDTLRVEKLTREVGSEFDLDEVLLVGGEKVQIGNPIVKGAKVTVVVTQQDKAPKVIVFKKKRRQGYRRLRGHRQLFTELFVKAIQTATGEVMEAEKKAQVIDPTKKTERNLKYADQEANKRKEAPKKAKVVAKKAAPKKKKAAPKKSSAKKKVAKKASKK
jgi:large subunit ribosomal protein L21